MKSILIIETPNDCYDCPCYYEDRDMCEVLNRKAKADSGKPSWCPLKPLPKENEVVYYNDYQFGFQQGFNECLEMIKGDSE